MLFSLDVAFEQGYPVTEIAIDVAQAFGIALDTRVFKVLNNVDIDIKPGDIVYIIGESGSGKSILLKRLTECTARQKGVLGDILLADEVKIDDDEVLVDSIGSSTDEAIQLLSRVGLNDAYLFSDVGS